VARKGWVVELDCYEVRRQLSDYVEYDLTLDARARIERHLEHCQNCAAVYDGVRNVVQLLGDEVAFDLPQGFSERLQTLLRVTSTQHPNHTA
jgi:anti-sigma factor (TIGR02949 family)